MLPLQLRPPPGGALSVLAIGAHPDDIEIGAGGLLLGLASSQLRARYVVLTGTAERHQEARTAARAFMPSADLAIDLFDLPEGRLPAAWDSVKEILETVARSCSPDVIVAPSADDAHQDHRTIAEIVPTVFRDQLSLAYEIPKWDGDLGRPSVYFPLSPETARHKVELLHKCFPSQQGRDWWDDEVFLGMARLRGMECRAPYAEAFRCMKSVLVLPHPGSEEQPSEHPGR
jgi:LmbE family N-acetylglucosaminyl deacetylase